MLQKMKQKALLGNLLGCVVLIVVAVGALWITNFAVFTFLKGPQPLETLDDPEGRYVSLEVIGIYDWYLEVQETKNDNPTGTIVERQYIVPYGDGGYMGVAVPSRQMDVANELMDQTNLYLMDETDELGTPMMMKGYVTIMDWEEEDFYHQVVGYDEYTNEEKAYFTPYLLRVGEVADGITVSSMWVYTAIALALVGLGIYLMVFAAVGGYQKDIRRLCAASADPADTMARIEQFYEETPACCGVRANQDWVMFPNGRTTHLVEADSIVWVYASVVNQRVNGIPVGKTRSLTMHTRDGKKYDATIRKEDHIRQVRDMLFDQLPGAVFGHSDQLEVLFRQDRAAFAELARQQHEPQAQAAQAQAANQPAGVQAPTYTV